jgi:hypothetical protein
MDNTPGHASFPAGFMAVFVVATALFVVYLWYLATFTPHNGDASVADAFYAFVLIVGLWLTLALLLVIAGVKGAMPMLGIILALPLTPVSGVAAFSAFDLALHHQPGGIILPALPAVLIACYALWVRLPRLRTLTGATAITLGIWGTVLAVTMLIFILAGV